jgi:hypothetical protein
MNKLLSGLIFFMTFSVVAQKNLVINGDMSQWTTGSELPDEFALGTNSTTTADYFSKSEETYNGLNAIKQTYRNSSSGSTRYFTTNSIYLEAGNYVLTFYVKGSGWLRTVNLTKGSAMPNSRESSDDNIVATPMGTSFVAQTFNEWTKYTVNYTITVEDSYVLSFSHNNVTSGNVMHLANIILEKDEFPENTQLTALTIGGNIIKDFSPEKLIYYYKLPYETSDTAFPAVGYVNQEGTTAVQTDASNLSGNEDVRTTTLVVSRGDSSLTYKVIFYRGGSPDDARMEEINFDGNDIENYSMDVYSYHQYLPYSVTEIPVVDGKALGTGNFSIVQATSLSGTEEQRTATLTSTSGDGHQSDVYKITFEILPKLDLFLCIGQSNMLGRGYINESLGDLDPLENSWLLTPGFNWEAASNPFNKYSSVSLTNKSKEGISPSYGFAVNIKDRVEGPIGLIVNAKGGTSIQKWTKGNSEGLYEAALVRAQAAQKWGQYKAILWHQGESNSSSTSAYPDQLKKMVADFRQDLNEPDLYFVAGELAYWRGGGTGSTAFNEMIRTISTFLTNSDYVSAEGLTPLIDETDPHFDRESNIELGRRYAVNVLEHIYGITSRTEEKTVKDVKLFVRNNQLVIENGQQNTKLQVVDITGKIVKDIQFDFNTEVKLQSKGIYVVIIKNDNGIEREKLIVP